MSVTVTQENQIFNMHEKCEPVKWSVLGHPAGRPGDCEAWQNFNVAIVSDTKYVINVKLCMMVLLTEHYLFIPLSVTLIIFQGHSSVKQF